MTDKHDAIKAGVIDAWGFWHSQHDISVPETIEVAVKDAVTAWLDKHGEDLFTAAIAKVMADRERKQSSAETAPAVEPHAECATTYRAESGDCDGPADRQVTYRASRNHDKVLDTNGPLCNAHAVYEQRRARAAGQIADSTIDPYGHARP